MQELQEQIPVIYMDVVYAGIAGANSCPPNLPSAHSVAVNPTLLFTCQFPSCANPATTILCVVQQHKYTQPGLFPIPLHSVLSLNFFITVTKLYKFSGIILKTAVERARGCCFRAARQGATTRQGRPLLGEATQSGGLKTAPSGA